MSTDLATDTGPLDVDEENALIEETLNGLMEPEAKAEEAGDKKPAAEKETNATAGGDEESTPGEEEKSVEPEEKEKSGEDDEPGWEADEDVQALAGDLGVSKEDLARFPDREAFDLHVELSDRQFMAAGKAIIEGQKESPEPEGSKVPKERPPSKEGGTGRFEMTLKAEDVGEEVVGEFQRLNDHWEGQFARMEERWVEADRQAVQDADVQWSQTFDLIVDGLGHKDLFGVSADLPDGGKDRGHRQDLASAVETLQLGKQAKGQDSNLTPALVERALRLEFADQLATKQRRSFTAKARKQAARVLGGGGNPKKESGGTHKGSLESDPALDAAWGKVEDG